MQWDEGRLSSLAVLATEQDMPLNYIITKNFSVTKRPAFKSSVKAK